MTFVSDSFTDADSTAITAHTGAVGATWTVHPSLSAGSAVITSNRLRLTSANDSIFLASGVPSTADYDVEWDMYIHPTYDRTRLGVYLRGSSTAVTGYYVWYDYFNGWFIQRLDAGVASTLATDTTTYASGSTTRAKGSIRTESGNTVIRLYINGSGTALFSTTDSTAPILTAGRVGVRAGVDAADLNGGQHMDYFSGLYPPIALTTPKGLWDREAVLGALMDDAGFA